MFENIYKRNLFSHICLYPFLKFEDIYKFLFQAVCGNSHLLKSKEDFIKSLDIEVKMIEEYLNLNQEIYKQKEKNEFADEPLLEFLREDKKYVRVNLRPYLQSGYDIDILKEACVRSAEKNIENSEKDLKEFIEVWNQFSEKVFNQSFYEEAEQYCKEYFSFSPTIKDKTKEFFKINLSKESFEEFNLFIVRKNYPIIHHSQEYLNLYKPYYRVLEHKELISKLELDS
ncbi:MAG: hypothetical protein NUV32_05610 [Exilispira sp.]|jgi:hypothetical protein|nr:hypothetical protein [Exilispira sp.]